MTLNGWVSKLYEESPAEPETVSGALLFADSMAQQGYPKTATALRETAELAAEVPTAPEPAPEPEPEPEPEHETELGQTELWVEHYVGGWNTLEDGPRGIILSAFVHLGMQTDGYVRHRPSEVDKLQAGEDANELDALGLPEMAAGLRDLIADSERLPEEP